MKTNTWAFVKSLRLTPIHISLKFVGNTESEYKHWLSTADKSVQLQFVTNPLCSSHSPDDFWQIVGFVDPLMDSRACFWWDGRSFSKLICNIWTWSLPTLQFCERALTPLLLGPLAPSTGSAVPLMPPTINTSYRPISVSKDVFLWFFKMYFSDSLKCIHLMELKEHLKF